MQEVTGEHALSSLGSNATYANFALNLTSFFATKINAGEQSHEGAISTILHVHKSSQMYVIYTHDAIVTRNTSIRDLSGK